MRNTISTFIGFILLFSNHYACNQSVNKFEDTQTQNTENDMAQNIYNLYKPDKTYKLPGILEEISGVSFWRDGIIASIQDEDGKIFFYDLDKKEIISSFKFAKDDDYEDVEVVGNDIWVVNSSGTLYAVYNFDGNKSEDIRKYKLPFSEKNDIEGMCYDSYTNSLVFGCKGNSRIDENMHEKHVKAFYRFDIDSETFVIEPLLYINIKEVSEFIEESDLKSISTKVLQALKIKGKYNLSCSAMAFHPETGELYVVSHLENILITCTRNGDLLNISYLEPKIFKQPEGICFNKDGQLYISNEGRGGKGNILEFKKL